MSPTRPSYSDDEALDALRAFAAEHGAAPTHDVWKREHKRPSATLIIQRFGSWSGALERAGLQSRPHGSRSEESDEQTAQVMRRLETEPVSVSQIARELGVSHGALTRRIARYAKRHSMSAPPTRYAMTAEELEDWQMNHDPRRRDL